VDAEATVVAAQAPPPPAPLATTPASDPSPPAEGTMDIPASGAGTLSTRGWWPCLGVATVLDCRGAPK
jgi:hypothetical protein